VYQLRSHNKTKKQHALQMTSRNKMTNDESVRRNTDGQNPKRQVRCQLLTQRARPGHQLPLLYWQNWYFPEKQ
jgi:hypothetical protein